MIRRALLRLLGAPELADALARVAALADQLEEYKARCAALDTLAASEEARADEAERLLDRETMINKRLGEELARARSTTGASWLVPRGPHDEDAAPRSIRPAGETVLRAEVATLRRELRACGCARASDADEVLR